MPNSARARAHTYLSTRSGASVIGSFETVVLKGLAPDGGLFLPAEIPIASDWVRQTVEFLFLECKV
jgi:threonine synthase